MADETRIRENEDDYIYLDRIFFAFLRLFKRFWWFVVVCAIAGAAFGFVKNRIGYHPMYRSTASFTVVTDTGRESGYSFYYDNQTAGQLANTFPYILSSNLLTEAIENDLGVDYVNGSISASAVSESNLITMTVTSSSAEDAAAILESAIRVYPGLARFVIGDTHFNMISGPTVPTEPYNAPSYPRIIVKWGAAGGAGALLLILLISLLRKTVQKPEDLSTAMSLECLGELPEVKFKARGTNTHHVISIHDDKTSADYKESIRSLWMRIDRKLKKEKLLLVTSTEGGEGKSSVAYNLACQAAVRGLRVLLIDGDLRKGPDEKIHAAAGHPGLAEVLAGRVPLEKAIYKDKAGDMYLLDAGKPGKQVVRLLESQRLQDVLDTARSMMDLVIVDAPPCDLFSDASNLAEQADSILYVTRYDTVQKSRVIEGVSLMEDTGVPIIGYVFNGVPVHQSSYGYSRYGYGKYSRYGYGEEE